MSLSNDSNMVMPVTPAYGMGGYGNGMWGGGWDSWILLFLIFGMFGRGGWGGWGNESNCCAPATCADLQRGFDNQSVMNKLNGLENGLCDGFYAQNTNILNGFHGVDTAVCQLGYNTQQGFNTLASQLASCCCETQSAIQGTRYDIATSAAATQNTIQNATRDLMENSNANSRAILQALNDNYVRTLERENSDLRMNTLISNSNAVNQAARDAQTAELLRRTGHDCPTAAYVVQPPTPVTFPNYCNPCGSCGV